MKDPDHASNLAEGFSGEGTLPESLGDLLMQCVDEALNDLLGKRTRAAMYDYLERNCSIANGDIPEHMNKFFELLEETFGKGSKMIGRSIIRKMFTKLELKWIEIPDYEFMDYLGIVRTGTAERLIGDAGSNSTPKPVPKRLKLSRTPEK